MPWIKLTDETLSAADLEAQVEARLAQREPLAVDFPRFGHVAPFPEPDRPWAPTLFYHLQQLNEMPPPATDPILAASPAQRVPLLGRFWSLIRRQAHALVLFYVNRAVAEHTRAHNHTLSVLNELTRIADAQQAEIERLRAALADRDAADRADTP